jgi:membrane-associated protease RseP (regulator of RpoE activity)
LNGYVIAAVIVLIYLAIVFTGHRLGAWKRLNVSLYGPVLMMKTKRGRKMIESLARAEGFWTWYGRLSTSITLVAMAAITLFLAYQVADVGQRTPTPDTLYTQSIELPQAHLGVTILYIATGFAVAIAAHEFAHGILTVVGKIKLASMGLLLLVIPIGAFVEPDDKDLKASSRSRRSSVYASGSATNILIAAVCMAILVGLVGPAATPIAKGAVVTGLAPDSPAAIYGLGTWSEILSVEGQPVLNGTQLSQVSFAEPGEMVSVNLLYDSEFLSLEIPGGVVVYTVMDGPGHDAGLEPGMIIRSLNDTPINTISEFRSVTENSSRNEPVNISVLRFTRVETSGWEGFLEDPSIRTLNLTSKWLYYRTHYPTINREAYRNVSFIAISVSPFGIRAEDPEYLTEIVAQPFDSRDGTDDLGSQFQRFISIPFIGYTPVVSPATDLYESSGALSFIPGDILWMLINLLYWVFWANLVVGLTNTLPAIPFDGGYVLRDSLRGFARWRELRLTGLDRAIGRKPVTEAQVDTLMWFISGMVIIVVIYIFLAGVWGSF